MPRWSRRLSQRLWGLMPNPMPTGWDLPYATGYPSTVCLCGGWRLAYQRLGECTNLVEIRDRPLGERDREDLVFEGLSKVFEDGMAEL